MGKLIDYRHENFVCLLCGKWLASAKSLVNHFNNDLKKIKACPICKEKFGDDDAMDHVYSHYRILDKVIEQVNRKEENEIQMDLELDIPLDIEFLKETTHSILKSKNKAVEDTFNSEIFNEDVEVFNDVETIEKIYEREYSNCNDSIPLILEENNLSPQFVDFEKFQDNTKLIEEATKSASNIPDIPILENYGPFNNLRCLELAIPVRKEKTHLMEKLLKL
jgi:hypothetical protein